VTLLDLDDAKSRPLVLESGYRLITAPNTPNENRLQEAATFRFPLFAQILLSDRNRFDLDWKNGSSTWRYRNKLTPERTFAIRSYHFIPYVAAEPFYESQYSKWSNHRSLCGILIRGRETRPIQSLLSVRERHGQKAKPAESLCGSCSLPLLFSAKMIRGQLNPPAKGGLRTKHIGEQVGTVTDSCASNVAFSHPAPQVCQCDEQ